MLPPCTHDMAARTHPRMPHAQIDLPNVPPPPPLQVNINGAQWEAEQAEAKRTALLASKKGILSSPSNKVWA